MNNKFLALVFIVLAFLVLSGGLIYYISFNRDMDNNSDDMYQSPSAELPTTAPTPVQVSNNFPLNKNDSVKQSLPGYKLIYAYNNNISLINGSEIRDLVSSEGNILEYAVSPDEQWLVFTYQTEGAKPKYFGYPDSGMSIVNLGTAKEQELIPSVGTTSRYPTWSEDGTYLAVWINDGAASKVYKPANGSQVLEVKTENEKELVSPIVFVPGSREVVAYINKGKLVEYNLATKTETEMDSDVSAYRPVHEGPVLPNPPYYLNDGKYVVYYKENGDLSLIIRATGEKKTIREGYFEENMQARYPEGYIVGFNEQDNLIFYELGAEGYQYGVEGMKSPYNIYNPVDESITNFPIVSNETDINSMIISPNQQKVVTHSVITDKGLIVYNASSGLDANCEQTDFMYGYYNWGGGPDYSSVLKVWSPDSKYIVSRGLENLSVMDTKTCKVQTIVDAEVKSAQWLP